MGKLSQGKRRDESLEAHTPLSWIGYFWLASYNFIGNHSSKHLLWNIMGRQKNTGLPASADSCQRPCLTWKRLWFQFATLWRKRQLLHPLFSNSFLCLPLLGLSQLCLWMEFYQSQQGRLNQRLKSFSLHNTWPLSSSSTDHSLQMCPYQAPHSDYLPSTIHCPISTG